MDAFEAAIPPTPRSGFSRLKAAGLLIGLGLFAMPAGAEDLAGIFEQALGNDPQIREARARYNAAHTTVAQGRSQLLPSVTVNATTSRDTSGPARSIETSPAHSFSRGFNSKGYGLNITQNLVNFEAWYAFQSSQKSDQVAAVNLAQAEQELILRVATAYFNVLRSLDNLEAFRAEEQAAQQVLEQTQEQFEVGLVPITDVYDSQANYDLARVNRLVEENNLDQRYEALEAITGQPSRNLEILTDEFPIDQAEPSDLQQWVQLAQENNLAVQAAEFEYEASEAEAKSARAAMYPTVDLSANYNWRRSANPFSFFPGGLANENSSISLNLTIPLYSGGLNSARKRQAYYTRDASREALRRTEREAVMNARNSYRSVATNVEAVQARQQAITSARSALDATEQGLEVGTRNVVDVVLAQRTLFQTMRDHANARYDYIVNTLNLKQASGVLSPQDVYDLNTWLEQTEGDGTAP